jgi:hypothetical protein
MRFIIIVAVSFLFSTSVWSADSLKTEMTNLFEAAIEYMAAGYQVGYVNQTDCKKYPVKLDLSYTFSAARKDVTTTIPDAMLQDLLKAAEPIFGDTTKEIDKLIGSAPSAFDCGKARGMAAKSYEQSQKKWLRSVKNFNDAKKAQAK